MNVRTIALSTFESFLHNKVILLFCSLFFCVVLLMMSPMLAFRSMTNTENAAQMQGIVLNEITLVMSLMSGFGSLLAAWAAADSIASEMKSGTVFAVMARPLRRWEFLAGKYLGVLMLMCVYILVLLGVTFLLAELGGQRFHTSFWTLLVYPMVRYAIWAAVSMLLVTLLHSVFVVAIVIVLATLVKIFGSSASTIPGWIRLPVHLLLPLTNLLSEDRFLTITQASLKAFSWKDHLTALAYGLDYALVCFLLAVFIFEYRNLSRE